MKIKNIFKKSVTKKDTFKNQKMDKTQLEKVVGGADTNGPVIGIINPVAMDKDVK